MIWINVRRPPDSHRVRSRGDYTLPPCFTVKILLPCPAQPPQRIPRNSAVIACNGFSPLPLPHVDGNGWLRC